MPRTAYVNGQFVSHIQAVVPMEDRGYQFADGIYEYMTFYNRRVIDQDLHFDRLERSVAEIDIPMPSTRPVLKLIIRDLIARNGYRDGGVYLQVTRGVARRDHPFPANITPSLTIGIYKCKLPGDAYYHDGIGVITHPDIRWKRPDIKSISLLGNVIAKQESVKQGAREAWLVNEQGMVTECSHSNCHIIDVQGRLITHPANRAILGGVMRSVVLRLARENGIEVIERPFSLEEAMGAAEAFNTSTTANVLPVTRIDGKAVSQGVPGPVTQKLQRAIFAHVAAQTGKDFDLKAYGL